MIEGLPAALFDQIGVVVVVLLVGLMVMRGRLVPQTFMKLVVGLLNERLAKVIEDRDNWRQAYHDMREINDALIRREDLSTTTMRSIKEAATVNTSGTYSSPIPESDLPAVRPKVDGP